MSVGNSPYEIFRKPTDKERFEMTMLQHKYSPYMYNQLPLKYPYHSDRICWTNATYSTRVVFANYFDYCHNEQCSKPTFFTVEDFRHLDQNWTFYDKLMSMSTDEATLQLSLNPDNINPWDLLALEVTCILTELHEKYLPAPSDTPLIQHEKLPPNRRVALSLCEETDIFDRVLADEKFKNLLSDFKSFLSSSIEAFREVKQMLVVFSTLAFKAFEKRHS